MADLEKQGRRRRRRVEVTEEEADTLEAEDDVEEVRGITAAKGRATPGRRSYQEEEQGGNFITRTGRGLREYFRGVQGELEKVTWPTREETIRLARIVVIVMIIASIVLGIISGAFTLLFQAGLDQPVVFAVFFVAVALLVVGYQRFIRRRAGADAPSEFNSRLF